MRKVLSFVLVLSLVLGSFGMAFAAPLSDVAGEDFEDAVNVLTELGVVQGYPDGTYKPENIVTRAEMAVIVISALGLEDYAVGKSSFSDMAGYDWAQGYVAYAQSLGIIAGYPDGTFKPGKTVSYDEAATMLVGALGYNADSLIGTWPANYVSKAKTLGILDGIKAGAAGANRGDIAIMTFQTLDQAMGKTNKDGDWVAYNLGTAAAPIDDTMLSRLGAQMYVPAAAEAWAATASADDFVILDNTDSVIDLKPYLGAYVKAAYANDDNEVIAIKEFGSIALEGTYDISEQEFETTDGVVYDTTRVDATAVINFANGIKVAGTAAMNAGAADFDGVLNVETSGKYLDEIYAFSLWVAEDTFQVDADMVEELADDDTINGFEFLMDDDDEIDMDNFALVGVDSLSDIEEDDIVTVYVETPGNPATDIAKLEVSKEVVTGVVTRVKGIANPYDFTVGGKVYTEVTAANVTGESLVNISAGDEVEFYLDYAGDIYISEIVEAEADLIGIILDSDAGSQGLNGTDTKFELFLADGTSKIFTADQDELDDAGILTLGTPNVFAVPADYANGTIVEYALDDDGVIIDIVPYLGLVVSSGTALDDEITAKGYFDGKKIASDATIVIATNTAANAAGAGDWVLTPDADDEYEFTDLESVLEREGLTDAKSLYSIDSGVIDFLVIVGGGATEDEIYGVFNAWFEDESDEGYGLELLIDGVVVEKEGDASDKAGWAAQIAARVLYEITYTDGVVTDLGAIAGGSTFTSTAGTAVTLDDGIASYNDGAAKTISVLDDAIVYVLNDDGDWEKGRLSDIKVVAADNKTVVFYTLDDDAAGVANIILVK